MNLLPARVPLPLDTVVHSDALTFMRGLPDNTVNCIVTSPPYWNLRDYGVDGQLGLEETPREFVCRLVEIFREAHRVLREDGVLWCNLGDSYASGEIGRHDKITPGSTVGNDAKYNGVLRQQSKLETGLRPKNLLGIPWSVAKALQEPEYQGRIKLECDRVWLAATLEAEGTICGFSHDRKDDGRTRNGIHIMITNSSMKLLDECQRIWPASKVEHGHPGKGHIGKLDTYRWLLQGVEEKTALIRELYPYMVSKRKQAVLAYNMLLLMADAKRLGHSTQRDEVREKRALLMRLLSEANHAVEVDIPSWCEEPTPIELKPGWILRSEIIWHKPNPMPESVTDRCTKSHEQVFMLAKSERYFFDQEAIREAAEYGYSANEGAKIWDRAVNNLTNIRTKATITPGEGGTRNRRTVWTIATEPTPFAHFATFPQKLIEPMILAGCPHKVCAVCGSPWVRQVEVSGGTIGKSWHNHENDIVMGQTKAKLRDDFLRKDLGFAPTCDHTAATRPGIVLDPFMGSGTTALVARRLGRHYMGSELNAEYVSLARERLSVPYTLPMFETLAQRMEA